MYFFILLNLLVGLPCIFYGYMISFKKKTNLINDYDAKRIKDKSSYLKLIGLSELIIGILMILSLLFFVLFIKSILIMAIIDFLLIIALITSLILADVKYSK